MKEGDIFTPILAKYELKSFERDLVGEIIPAVSIHYFMSLAGEVRLEGIM